MANDRKQGKAHWKERAQDELMHAIANAVCVVMRLENKTKSWLPCVRRVVE